MVFEEMFQPGVAPLVSAFTTLALAIFTFYFKWLIGSLKKLELRIADNGSIANKIQESLLQMIDRHEVKDQTRHEENLYRFEKISVALARMGSKNGSHD